MIRETAVRLVKPRVPEGVWNGVRRLDPTSARRDDERSARAADLSRRDLTELAELFQTDKWGPRHRYTPHYEAHLKFLKHRRFELLEIGIGGYAREQQGGASLRMWKAYFPRAQVVGLDIEDKSFVDEDRIVTYQGSQTDTALLDQVLAEHPVSVVVDDGSHRSEHVRATFAHLFPLLPPGSSVNGNTPSLNVLAVSDASAEAFPRGSTWISTESASQWATHCCGATA